MIPLETTPAEALEAFEAATGAGASILSCSDIVDGRFDLLLAAEWGTVACWELPFHVMMQVRPYGDFDIVDPTTGDLLVSGFVQDRLPKRLGIGATIEITDEAAFSDFLGKKAGERIGVLDMPPMIALEKSLEEAGLEKLAVTSLSIRGSTMRFEIQAQIQSMQTMVAAARDAYLGSWFDGGWLPRSPQEALFELCLASNANPSPSDIGFEFTAFHEFRQEIAAREKADAFMIEHPEFVPAELLAFSDWLGLVKAEDPLLVLEAEDQTLRFMHQAALGLIPSHEDTPQI